MATYKLLEAFRATFSGHKYRHRSSTAGDKVAAMLYEDMLDLERSPRFAARVASRTCGTARRNLPSGLRMRRGDGVFGEFVPGITPRQLPGKAVACGPLATIEIGAEVKILAKAMIKQIDRVMNDMVAQAGHFRKHGCPICIGLAGVNHAHVCTSYEGDRAFRTDGSPGFRHPAQEAPEAERRLSERVLPAFDEFLFLRYRATNEEPYPFEWVNPRQTFEEYGALLTRLSIEYEQRS